MKKEIYYITYNELVDEAYESQVLHFLDLLKAKGYTPHLLAFFPISKLNQQSKLLKKWCNHPFQCIYSFPGKSHWKKNIYTLSFYIKNNATIIARDIWAYHIASLLSSEKKKSLIYHAHNIDINNKNKSYALLEKTALFKSDFIWCHSDAVINYWAKKYQFNKNNYQVIPVDSSSYYKKYIDPVKLLKTRKSLGVKGDEILIALLLEGMEANDIDKNITAAFELLQNHPKTKLLTTSHPKLTKLYTSFPNQVLKIENEIKSIANHLIAADYGILLLEKSPQNWISHPVTYSNYLFSGVMPIIKLTSSAINHAYQTHEVGVLYHPPLELAPLALNERKRIRFYADQFIHMGAQCIKIKAEDKKVHI